MTPKDPTEKQRQPGQSIKAPAQQGGSPLSTDEKLGNRQQDQQNLDDIGRKDNSNVDPVDNDEDEEEKRTDDR